MDANHIPLREWVRKAIDSIDSSLPSFPTPTSGCRHLHSSYDDPFLVSALKVAFLLADKICKLEEAAALIHADESNPNERPPNISGLPIPSSDWASRITVHLKNSSLGFADFNDDDFSFGEENDHQLLPFNQSSQPEELHPIEESFVPNLSLVFESSVNCAENESCQGTNENLYLNVDSTEFLSSLTNDAYGKLGEKNERLYSLGLVFYELFSGGKIPPEMQSLNSSSDFDKVSDPESEPSGKNLEPLPISDSRPLNFGDALQILGDIGGGYDSIGGSDNGPLRKEYAEEKDAIHCNKKFQRSSKPTTGEPTGPISIEPLKMLGLPAALCDLIENMLDSVNVDFSTDDAYSEMKDVRGDLQLMLEKPIKFLRDLDLNKLSNTGLQLDNFDDATTSSKFSTLLSAYERSVSEKSELVIISGPSGVGKSYLARQLGSWSEANSGIFLSGKFDQLRQAQSFSAVVEALDAYCSVLARDKASNHTKAFSAELTSVLGQDAYYLARVIPNLGQMLNQEELAKDLPEQEYQDGQKRLEHLLCQLVGVISQSTTATVTLFLDDLQWADPSSVEVMKRLLLLFREKKKFFILGCCRDKETCPDHPIWRMTSVTRDFCIKTTMISLSCMDKEVLNMVVSNVLCLFPRLTRPLSDLLYHKTKGNTLFFSRLLQSLNREGLLRLSLNRRRWIWDEEKIQQKELPDDVATFFASAIQQHSIEIQSAISLLSCFGRCAERLVLETLEKAFQMPLIGPLDEAAMEGLVDKIQDKYIFSHDRLQLAAYNIMKEEEKCLHHSKYGIALCAEALESGSKHLLFIAVSQVNRGGPAAVSDKAQSLTIAKLNLMVGKRSMEMSDFESAFSYFDHGISFLRKNHWEEQYTLSLDLFEGASKAAFVIRDVTSLLVLSGQILRNAKSFEDKLNTLYITMNSLAYASKLQESMEKGFEVLSRLGEEVPNDCSLASIEFQLEITKNMFSGVSDNDLMNYKHMTDGPKIMAMKFLAKMSSISYMIRPSTQPLITLKIVQLSLIYGISSMTPIGIVHFGALLAKLGDIQGGYRFVKIAKVLNDNFGSKEVAGEVFCASTQVMCYVEPLQTANEFHKEGYFVSMSSGDMGNAMLNSLLHSLGKFWSGSKLPLVEQYLTKARQLMEQQNHLTWLRQLVLLERNVRMLIGESANSCNGCSGTAMEDALLHNNPRLSKGYYFNKMYVCFIFRDFDQMKDFAEKFLEYNVPSWSLLYVQSMHIFFTGLISFWIARKSNNDPTWEQRGHAAIRDMKLWSESSRWTFENKLYLLEAEEQYCRGDFEGAKFSYARAITSAKEHKFIQEEALACELAGYFHSDLGYYGTSVNFFAKAQEKYHEWGALAKASKLDDILKGPTSLSRASERPSLSPNAILQHQLDEYQSSNRKRAPHNHDSLPVRI